MVGRSILGFLIYFSTVLYSTRSLWGPRRAPSSWRLHVQGDRLGGGKTREKGGLHSVRGAYTSSVTVVY